MKKAHGFTIVELLIVIVVIAILAAISYVGYTSMSTRARDAQRLSDAQQILRAIEAYRTLHGSLPPTVATTSSSCGSAHTNGYSYSTATDGRWMSSLITSNTVSSVPVAPDNGCGGSYYRYLKPAPNSYNCPSRTSEYAVFQVYGVEGAPRPTSAVSATWYPCGNASTGWGASGITSVWTFILE